MVRGPATSDKVFDYFRQRPHLEVVVPDIVTATGLTREQVLNSISNLRNRAGLGIETLLRGHAYRYVPGKIIEKESTGKRLFEEIGPARDGRLVIQDTEGALFVAMPI